MTDSKVFKDIRIYLEEDREFVTGIWPPEFERILNGGEKTLSETCAEVPLLSVSGGRALAEQRNRKLQV